MSWAGAPESEWEPPRRRRPRLGPAEDAGPLEAALIQALDVVQDAMAPRRLACSRCGEPLGVACGVVLGVADEDGTMHFACWELDQTEER